MNRIVSKAVGMFLMIVLSSNCAASGVSWDKHALVTGQPVYANSIVEEGSYDEEGIVGTWFEAKLKNLKLFGEAIQKIALF